MIIGKDITLRVHKHARAEALELALVLARHAGYVKKETEKRTVIKGQKWVRYFLALGYLDVHHRRDILFGDLSNGGCQIYSTCGSPRVGPWRRKNQKNHDGYDPEAENTGGVLFVLVCHREHLSHRG